MGIKETANYLTAFDYLTDRVKQEQVLLEEATGKEHALPAEADLKTMGKVYAERFRTMVEYPAVFAARITGIHYLLQQLDEEE